MLWIAVGLGNYMCVSGVVSYFFGWNSITLEIHSFHGSPVRLKLHTWFGHLFVTLQEKGTLVFGQNPIKYRFHWY